MRNFSQEQPILTAKAETGVGSNILVEDFQHIVLSLDTIDSANLVVKFAGSLSDTEPDFSAAQSTTNRWDYIEVKDLQDGSAVDGDTGITMGGTDDHRILEANINGLKWFTAIVTARSAGSVTVKGKLFND